MNIKELLEAKYAGTLSRESISNAYKTVWKNQVDNRDGDVIIDSGSTIEVKMIEDNQKEIENGHILSELFYLFSEFF